MLVAAGLTVSIVTYTRKKNRERRAKELEEFKERERERANPLKPSP